MEFLTKGYLHAAFRVYGQSTHYPLSLSRHMSAAYDARSNRSSRPPVDNLHNS